MSVVCIQKEEFEKWDAFVEAHPHGWLSHQTSWCTVLEQSFPHIQGHFLAVRKNNVGHIRSGIAMYLVRSRLIGTRLVSVPFSSLCDPLLDRAEDAELLLNALLDFQKEAHASHVEIHTSFSDKLLGNLHPGISQSYCHHFIPLDSSPELIMKTFHKSCVQRAIKKALSSDLRLHIAADEQDMACFYRLYVLTRKRLALPPMPYRFFQALWKVYGRTGHLQLLFAVHAGRSVAGVIMLICKGRSILEFIADDGCARQLRPVHFLIWESIQRAQAMGCNLLSLGRTHQNNTGLLSFKEHWGTVTEDMRDYYFPSDAAPMGNNKEASVKYRIISAVARKSPGWLFQLLGNFCYRHLG